MEFTPFPRQLAAIEAPLGPTLVLAGPGAGKTFCLIGRVEHLLTERDFEPTRICTVTFTNKAAEEVAVRLRRTVGTAADEVTRGTLHALCLGILRDHPEGIGLRRGFGVADEDYQRILLWRLGVRNRRRREGLLTLFGRHRLAGHELSEGDHALFDSYRSLLREKNLVDFDDIIALTADLFRRSPAVADTVAERWDYLLVDEFQDLDAAQYSVLKRLGHAHRNVFAVGDDEQSIFAWRGSDPRILWRFRTDFGVEEPLILDRNCRCSRQIFAVARRLMAENTTLFQKQVRAERDSDHEVEAFCFEDDGREAEWILNDLITDRGATGRSWGDYAVLYRRHDIGERLEDRLIGAGVPCRLARGHSLLDDTTIGYVVASLRLMSSPRDPLAVEAFAERMLPAPFFNEVRTLVSRWDVGPLEALRRIGRTRPKGHPERRLAWRFVYHVENLRALYRSHTSLLGLVEAVLSERVERYGNVLEERHDELEDPAGFTDAADLAERVRRAVAGGGTIWLQPRGGVEIALRGMLAAADVPVPVRYLTPAAEPHSSDVVIPGEPGRPAATALFKALQLLHSRTFPESFRSYVTFDLETTGLDPESCEIVEIGAAKVVGGRIVDTFHSLVRADAPITPGASRVHGYREADLRDAPRLEEIWPRFRKFVGEYTVVVHNGHRFDIPVLRRAIERFASLDDLVFFDTLPLARALYRGSARLEDLAERFDVELDRAHHALDDAVALAHIFTGLTERKAARARKAAAANLLDHLGLGLALEPPDALADEDRVLLDAARIYALGRYSDCLEFYAAQRADTPAETPDPEDVIERLGGRSLMERIRAERTPAERYPAAFARLGSLVEASRAPTLTESVRRLLEQVALSTSEGVEVEPHRVNLLTLHATKGLEFSRVYIAGVEDYQLPGYYAAEENRTEEIQEARRLLYVGMTRARDRLVLTRVTQRAGRPAGGSMFLDEIGLAPASPGDAGEPASTGSKSRPPSPR